MHGLRVLRGVLVRALQVRIRLQHKHAKSKSHAKLKTISTIVHNHSKQSIKKAINHHEDHLKANVEELFAQLFVNEMATQVASVEPDPHEKERLENAVIGRR